MNALSSLLEDVNQYLPNLRAAVLTVPSGVHVGLELEDTQAAVHGDIAGIVHITNMHSIKERSIVIHQCSNNTTQWVFSMMKVKPKPRMMMTMMTMTMKMMMMKLLKI